MKETIAVILYYLGFQHSTSTFIDEDTITAGYGGQHKHGLGDFNYPFPMWLVKKVYGTVSWTKQLEQSGAYKFFYVELETRDGEREYEHKSVFKISKLKLINADHVIEEHCATFWCGSRGERIEEGEYEFAGGEIVTYINDVREISLEQYRILCKFLPTHVV